MAMDADYAQLLIEEDLLKASKVDVERLGEFKEAIVVAATTHNGYSGLAWRGGVHLVKLAEQLGETPYKFFSQFGWQALANGFRAGIHNRQILSTFSFADTEFVPQPERATIFEQPQVVKAIRLGFQKNPQSFIKPAELSATTLAIQSRFGELLTNLSKFNATNELIMQWSSSVLRVLSPQSEVYLIAAIKLLEILQSEKRIGSAYYSFRAIAEQRNEIWFHPITVPLVGTLIKKFWQQKELGIEVLIQLCSDDDVLNNMLVQFDLTVIVGLLAIALTHQHPDNRQIEAAAWRFVNEIFVSSPFLANTLTEYLTDRALPPSLLSKSDEIRSLTKKFDKAINLVEQELRPRRYKYLANRIYQENLQVVFTPLLHQIESNDCSVKLVEKIRQIDPEKLVADSDLLQASTDNLGRRVLNKMINDNKKTLEALENAALKKIKLVEAQADRNNINSDEIQIYIEVEALFSQLDPICIDLWATLLPELKERFDLGIVTMKKEQESRQYATW